MKKTLILALFIFLIPIDSNAYELGGSEFVNNFGTELALNDTFGIRASYTHFYVPSVSKHIHFIYMGPTFNIKDVLWISPQAGFAGNWVPDKDAFYGSLWLNLSLFNGKLSFFTETDAVFYDQKLQDYYGFYSLNYCFASNFNAGIHAEQINKGIMSGPHIGFKKDMMSTELQLFFGDETFNFRIAMSLNF